MSNTPNNPLNPLPPDKGPWLYSGSPQPTPSFQPPSHPSAAVPQPPTGAQPSAPAASTSSTSNMAHPPSDGGRHSDDASLASIIDTIEAIIIALVLALSFRAFIIEAFVIPTGSMAPTLQGAHFNVICPKCGYAFTRDARLAFQIRYDSTGKHGVMMDFSHDESRQELLYNTNIPADGTDPIICPNCQNPIDPATLPQHLSSVLVDDQTTHTTHDRKVAWANNGDRILVLKYLYSIMEPDRFDVIVFKEPQHAQDNYIKRLIGLPYETIEVIDGDIYVGPPGKSNPEEMTIARKPERAQKEVWQLVYDNDFYPTDEGEVRKLPGPHYAKWDHFPVWTNPWRGEGPTADSWNNPNARTADGKPVSVKTVGGPVIHYANDAAGRLRFHPRDPYAYNLLGYNDDVHDLIEPSAPAQLLAPVQVNDFRLETTWTPQKQAGCGISLVVGAPANQMKATWSSAGLALQRFDPAKGTFTTVANVTPADCPPPRPGHAYHVALNNVDHAAQFYIDGKQVASYLVPSALHKGGDWCAADAIQEVQDTKDPNQAPAFTPELYVDVAGECSLGHLKISRDLYYTQDGVTATKGRSLTLGADEFFAMGDNSRESSDGRWWSAVFPALDDLGTRPGIVPRRYLLGKAVFVYWPAGFRFMDSIHIPLVPNIGEMRFIR